MYIWDDIFKIYAIIANMQLKYRNVMDKLLELFTLNNYQKGDKLPSEPDLMARLGVGRNTIRKAILELENQGVVVKKQGSGTFYISHTPKDKAGGLIGLVNFTGMEYIYTDVITGIEDVLTTEGYSMVVVNTVNDSFKDINSIKRMVDQGVKGIIIDLSAYNGENVESLMIDFVKSIGVPVIATHWNGSYLDFSTISLNDIHGGYEATKYLISMGHKRIAMIYKDNVQAGCKRFDGYCKALKEAGIPFDKDLVYCYDGNVAQQNDPEFSKRCTTALLNSGVDFTAVFYFNDMLAMEGYRVFKERGLRIPDDVSVIGFDDNKHTDYLSPPLTTIEHPKSELGYWATQLLLAEIKGKTRQHKSLVFEPVLIERDSVKKIV